MMKEWSDNKRKKMAIMHELNKLVPHMSLIENRGDQPCELKGFQEGTQVHKCLHDNSYEGSGGGLPKVQDGKRGTSFVRFPSTLNKCSPISSRGRRL